VKPISYICNLGGASVCVVGIYMTGIFFGPAIGYLAGGSFLDMYVDFPASPSR